MLLPESMSRVLIVGSKSHMEDTVKALYDIGKAHLIDYSEGDDPGFSIGKSFPNAAVASERLVKLRAMEKELGLKEKDKQLENPVSAKEIRELIESNGIEQLEKELFSIVDSRNEIAQQMTERESLIAELRPLTELPLSLEDYRGYESITAIVGKVRDDPSECLKDIEHELFLSPSGKVAAIFVPKGKKEEAMSALSAVGFSEMSVPEGKGSPGEIIAELEKELEELREQKERVDAQLGSLKDKHLSFILASEEELAIETELASTPLRVATSDHSFVMDAWVPTIEVESFKEQLTRETADSVHVDVLETRGRSVHESEETESKFKDPPSKLKNGRIGKIYEYFVTLINTPRYQESDPSTLIAFTWPLFFGLMVADVGYAFAFIIIGAIVLKKTKSTTWKALGTQSIFGGIWALIFGLFMFGEMFGMHFVSYHEVSGLASTDWETIIAHIIPGFTFPAWLMDPSQMSLSIGINKFEEVNTLLKLSVYIGIVHLFFGFLIGFFNVKRQHSTKEAIYEKASFIMMLVGIVMVSYVLTELLLAGKALEGDLTYLIGGGAGVLAVGAVLGFRGEGLNAILELPGIFGNILSYTRLTAIALSKAGVAMAFNYISIFLLYVGVGGVIGFISGLLIFMVGHLLVFLLAVLSAGLHGIRLHYVEWMGKFFAGGGKDYKPLAINRLNTKNAEKEVY
ncbi:MAG: V/A-type H+/Na+-transporting ATPase subunit [Candidatus Methanomethylophilaceae archaeon]|nr:V/A-type H+/Na+-transporting ATPase subunit [Candidatus Methanomethylophilaceae archaeon]